MDFTQVLPYDVLCQIFTAHAFTNEDCVEFTKVCRSWRSDVPTYTTMIWHQAQFSGHTWARTDKQVAPFLGPHVHKVSIDNFEGEARTILPVLEMLTRTECFHIEKLVFRLCTFAMDDRILSLISRLGRSKLVELAFIRHMANLPFKAIIAACPQLMRFFYSVDSEQDISPIDYYAISSREPVIQSGSSIDDDKDDAFINMTCLSIDVPVSYPMRLEPILKKCPNLCVLRVGDTDVQARLGVSATIINITDIFRWCPYLQCLECNNSCPDPLKMAWWKSPRKQLDYEGQDGLREFVYYEGFQEEESYDALDRLINHQSTLRSLTMGRNRSSYSLRWNHLETLNFPQLRSLKLYEICIKEQALASLITHCPSLEVVHLDTYPLIEFYPAVFGALQTVSHLQDLTVDYKFAGDPLHGGGWDISRRFEMLTPLCDYLDAMTDKNLQRLQVNFNHLLDVLHARFLSAVASVASIQVFAVCNRNEPRETDDNSVTQGDAVAFIHRLKSNTQVQTLTFGNIDFLYPSVFDAMGELKHLTGLLLNNCTSFTVQDVLTLLKKTRSLEHLIVIDNEAKIWTDPSSFASQVNSSSSQCSYIAALVNPNMILIKQFG